MSKKKKTKLAKIQCADCREIFYGKTEEDAEDLFAEHPCMSVIDTDLLTDTDIIDLAKEA